jgi:deoxyribodipyrimidine photo-lyase
MGVQVVWLKRDLRLRDHAALARAAAAGPVLVVYVHEPALLRSPEFDSSHLVFINQCLEEMATGLAERGVPLTVRVGDLPDAFDRLRSELADAGGFAALWSHEETGLEITYARDRRIATWCREHGIPWTEIPQNGVQRPVGSRDGWSRRWRRRMLEPVAVVPDRMTPAPVSAIFDHGGIMTASSLGLEPTAKVDLQPGGERAAGELLHSFLHQRGENYRADMSSPVTGWDGCSRLSPHLAWGSLSIREVFQALETRRRELKDRPSEERGPRWLPSLVSFGARLRWHCHFMQKLEDEPALEFRNLNRTFDGLREDAFDEERFAAWCEGRTGYPMVDASMRCLHRHGWVNFRMRAMLVSFASYHLWLHWRPTAVYLAQHFLDFEPGIHFSQFQMQSGVTGINTVRIYSPIKQVRDQDPGGEFIRRFVPELHGVPDEHLAEPHRMGPSEQDRAGCRIGRDYPAPIVEHASAYREARRRMSEARRQDGAREEAERVYRKHGSRKRPSRRSPRRKEEEA